MTQKWLAYVSGALSDLPEEVRERYLAFYVAIGELLASCGLEPYVPHLHTDPVKHKDVTPGQVDDIDRTAVTMSVIVVAVLDYPSLGVGGEVEMAYHANKPVVALCQKDRLESRRISRLTRGNPAVAEEIVYRDHMDALAQLGKYIRTFMQCREESILPEVLK
jgi:2'-deoxynucleoside 5'-phosphate N-hydrolase